MTDQEYVQALWERARESLKGAEVLVSVDPNAAASRAYYAAFHAVTALFGLEGRTFKKHTDVLVSVHRDLVHAGRWPIELGDAFSHLNSQRRLFYVGCSRAMRYLFVTYDRSLPSPFLEKLSDQRWARIEHP